jgi:hypothetical protein
MVSDIVTLRELPALIRKTAEAYVGCLSGAIRKEKYLKAIKDAGFKKVKVIDELSPMKLMFDGSMVNEIIKKFGISEKKLKEEVGSVLSIKVSAVK